MHKLILRYLNKQTKNTVLLFALQIVFLILNVVASSVTANALGSHGYGQYSLATNIFLFSLIFFSFGYFTSASSLIANTNDIEVERKIIGTSMWIAVVTGIIYCLVMFLVSYILEFFYGPEIPRLIRQYFILIIFLPFQILIPQLAKGTGKVLAIGFFNILTKFFYILGIIICINLNKVTIDKIIEIYLLSILMASILVGGTFKPNFKGIKEQFFKLKQVNKSFGNEIYKGQLVDQIGARIDILVLGLVVEPKLVGIYALAKQLTEPIYIFSQSLSTSYFKIFARNNKIGREVTAINIFWLISSSIGLLTLSDLIVKVLFGDNFIEVNTILAFLLISVIIRGMYVPYNLFLSSKMQGKIMKKASYYMGIVNIIISLPLIFTFKVAGAVSVNIIGYVIYGMVIYFGYKKFQKQPKKKGISVT
jgi:O-antigen/teichoic acid export membrane protein